MTTFTENQTALTLAEQRLVLVLDNKEGPPTWLIVLPVASGAGSAPAPVHYTVVPVQPDADDDLANATWEDAEWR